MPCRSDYMEPTSREKESKKVATHLVYVFNSLGLAIPEYVKEAYRDSYGGVKDLNKMTAALCSAIRVMPPNQLEAIVFDGHNPGARSLADWWDYHQKVDAKRKAEAQTKAQQTVLKKSGLAKLTRQERSALGL